MPTTKPRIDEETLQRLTRDFVSREVIYCVSALIYELSQKPDASEDEELSALLGGYQPCPECDGAGIEPCPDCDHEAHCETCHGAHDPCNECDDGEVLVEVFEHWIVTGWLRDRLAEKGEVTGDFSGLVIWGRQTTGQAIYLDHVIREIYLETHPDPRTRV